MISFIDYLCEMGEEKPDARIEDMDPQELTKMARMKQTNPKMANVQLLKKLKMALRNTTDPKEKASYQQRIQNIQKGGSEEAMV